MVEQEKGGRVGDMVGDNEAELIEDGVVKEVVDVVWEDVWLLCVTQRGVFSFSCTPASHATRPYQPPLCPSGRSQGQGQGQGRSRRQQPQQRGSSWEQTPRQRKESCSFCRQSFSQAQYLLSCPCLFLCP